MSECRNAKFPEHHHGGKSSEKFLDKNQILACLPITPGQVILDAGCGNGYMAKEFAGLTGETGTVYALDPDTASIGTLKAETVGTVIEPFVGDITRETRLQAASIDLIYLSTVIHGFSEAQMEGFLQEVLRLLKPSGRLAIVEIKKEDTPFGPPLTLRFSPAELRLEMPGLMPSRFTEVGDHFYLQVFER